jgi:ketosteroid isomerase-like protein
MILRMDPGATTAELHKQIVAEFFAQASAGNLEGVMALLTDDASWRLAGKPELSPTAGTYDKPRIRRLLERMRSQLKEPLKMTVVGCTAEGDRAAVEVVSSGDLRNGREYRQEYHFVMIFRDGRIAVIREYFDTQHAYEVWIRR